MFGKCPNRIAVFSCANTNGDESKRIPIIAVIFIFIVIQATENRRDAVITLLPGIEMFVPGGELKFLRNQEVGSRNIKSVRGELGKGRSGARNRARVDPLLEKFADQIKWTEPQPCIHAPGGSFIGFRQHEGRERSV